MVDASVPIPKRAPGRPRAVKLDTPRRPAQVPVKPVPAATAQIAPRSMSDLRPVGPRPDALPPVPVKAAPKPPRPRLATAEIVAASLRALQPRWIISALPGAALVAAGLVLGVWDVFYRGAVMSASQLTMAQIGELIAAAGIFLGGLAWLRLVRAAVMFQRAGVNDHRLDGFAVAWLAAMSRTVRLMGLRLRHGLMIAFDLGLLVALVWYGGRPTVLPPTLQLALVFLGCFGLLYLLGSIWVVHRLIEAGIVMSGLSVRVAHRLSWRFWRHHWELLGLRFIALGAVLLIGSGLAYGLVVALSGATTGMQLSGAVIVLTLALAILTVISGGAAESIYRQLIKLERPYRASQLLGGRRPLRPSAAAVILQTLSLVLPLGVALAALIYLH